MKSREFKLRTINCLIHESYQHIFRIKKTRTEYRNLDELAWSLYSYVNEEKNLIIAGWQKVTQEEAEQHLLANTKKQEIIKDSSYSDIDGIPCEFF